MATRRRTASGIELGVHGAPGERHWARYEEPDRAQVDVGIWICGAGRNSVGRVVRRKRRLGTWGLLWITRGTGWFESGPTGRRKVTPGTLIRLLPDVPHSYQPREPWAYRWVFFGGRVIEGLERQGWFRRGEAVVHTGMRNRINDLLARLVETYVPGGYGACTRATAILYELLVAINQEERAAGGGAEADALVEEAMWLIDRGAATGLSPEDLARKLNVGYSTLRRRFRGRIGHSMKDELTRVRMARARELLTLSSLSIGEVADAVGIDDQFYFSRLFRKREGCSPKAYRARRASTRVPTE